MKHITYLILVILCVPFAFSAAFSSPFLVNKTIILQNELDSYNYTIVFQNPTNETSIMHFEVLNGKEWLSINEFNVTVEPFKYDVSRTIVIKKPNSRFVNYGELYTVEYIVTEKGEANNLPGVMLTGQVKKIFYVQIKPIEEIKKPIIVPIVQKEPNNMFLYILIILVIIAISIVIMVRKSKEQPKQEVQPVVVPVHVVKHNRYRKKKRHKKK